MKTALKTILAALILSMLVVGSAQAQIQSKKSLTLDAAKRIVAAAAAYAKANNEGGVIAIVDDGGNLIYLERLDGTFVAGSNISIGKARTSAIFKKPTKFFEEVIKNGRTAMVALNEPFKHSKLKQSITFIKE